MGLITKGESDWDNKINEYVAKGEKVYTWSNQSTNGFTLSAKRVGHTVNFVFDGLKERQQVKGWTEFLPGGFIPAGFRPVDYCYLLAERTPGIVDGQKVDWQNGMIVINPDGSLATRAMDIPTVDHDNPASTYVSGKGTTATGDDYPVSN